LVTEKILFIADNAADYHQPVCSRLCFDLTAKGAAASAGLTDKSLLEYQP
jgi:hypothetical protein